MILITGASGLLGQHLTRLLAEKRLNIRALYNSHPPAEELTNLPGVQWLKCDLLDTLAVEEAMNGVDQVYHCAAIVSFHSADNERMLHVNTEITANLVNQALSQGVEKMVHISSVAAIGRNGDANKTITEEENWEESTYGSAYGVSKHMAEMEVWRGIGEGLNAVVLNPGIILGPGNWNEGSAQLICLADKEFPFYTNGVNGWVDVRDVALAAYSVMNSSIQAERFIVSAGNFSYREIFTKMAEQLGRKKPGIASGPLLTGLAWRAYALQAFLTGRKSLVTRTTAETAATVVRYNNEKLLEAVPGFAYRTIGDTIAFMAQAYRSDCGRAV